MKARKQPPTIPPPPQRQQRRRCSDPIPDATISDSSVATATSSSSSSSPPASFTPAPACPSSPDRPRQTTLPPRSITTFVNRHSSSASSRGCGGDRRNCLRRAMEFVAGRLQARTAAAPAASADHLTPVSSGSVRGACMHNVMLVQRKSSSGSVRQRRLDLEQEVAELKKQLTNEQKVHEILDRALQSTSAQSIVHNIPAFIPKKTKELLAELVVVEEEIARLENQIENMKGGLGAMQESRARTSTSYSGQDNSNAAAAATRAGGIDAPPLQAGKVAPEIKSMFFISQAMNEEYLKRHLGGDRVQEKKESPRETALMRRGAMSPKNTVFGFPPRHSVDKLSDHVNVEKPSHILHEPSSTIKSPRKKDEQKIHVHPNKLSETVLRCLICIFQRLLRTSRAVELERSGNMARSANSFLGSGSFRTDAGVTASMAKEKVIGQQDHYGIFEIPDSIVRDLGPYKNLVRFTASSFDLRGISSSSLFTKLREMLEALQHVDLSSLTHQQKLAFWLNMYNTCIMNGILQHGLPSNSEKLLALKNKATVNVGGQKFSALAIENFVLRQPSSVKEEFWKYDTDIEEQKLRHLYGLDIAEPNILFALCCGIRSSPAVRIYKPDRVTVELEKAKMDYLQSSLVVTSTGRLVIPSLIHSNMYDFAKDLESLVRWLCDQLPTSWSLRRSMVDCLRVQTHLKIHETVDVIPYDYEFQYLLPM